MIFLDVKLEADEWRKHSRDLGHALSDALRFYDADRGLGADIYRRILWHLASHAEDYT